MNIKCSTLQFIFKDRERQKCGLKKKIFFNKAVIIFGNKTKATSATISLKNKIKNKHNKKRKQQINHRFNATQQPSMQCHATNFKQSKQKKKKKRKTKKKE
jgi:hypothetical protein